MRLGGILHQRQLVLAANLQHRVHVKRMPVKMHRHDRLRPRRDRAFDQFRVQIERRVVNVHIDRLGADVGNRPTRRHKRVRRGDDFVARPDVQQQHRHVQRGGAAVEAHAVFRPAIMWRNLSQIAPHPARGKTSSCQWSWRWRRQVPCAAAGVAPAGQDKGSASFMVSCRRISWLIADAARCSGLPDLAGLALVMPAMALRVSTMHCAQSASSW